MKVLEINSPKNDTYKQWHKLKQRKYRYKESLFLIEGSRFVSHALEVGASVQQIICREDFLNTEEAKRFIENVQSLNIPIAQLTASLFDTLSETVNSQGVMAVVAMPMTDVQFESEGLYLALDRIQDPGNLGTLIRTADAAGFSGVICNKGTVDPFSEKVLRSTMGSIFTMPLYFCDELADVLTDLKEKSFNIYATALENSLDYTQANYANGTVLVIGNEGNGISKEVFDVCNQKIHIPMYGRAESLNAAIAAAIVMYEAVNQRRKRPLLSE